MRYLLWGAAWSPLAFIALAIFLATFQTASAADADCNDASMVIQGADPSPFVLPRDQGQTMKVEPDSVLLLNLVAGEATTLQDPVIGIRLLVSGIELATVTEALGTGDDPDPVYVNLKEQLPPGMTGLYEVEGVLIDEGEDICAVDFLLQVGGFCVATSVTTVAMSVSGAGALASVVPAMKLMLLPTMQRRRPTGWRRYILVPDLKWTLITTVVGAIAGLVTTTLLFQQTGVQPVSFMNALWGILSGGGLTFSVAYIGALATYFMSPEAPREPRVEEKTGDPGTETK